MDPLLCPNVLVLEIQMSEVCQKIFNDAQKVLKQSKLGVLMLFLSC